MHLRGRGYWQPEVQNALIQAPDVPTLSSTLVIKLLPALPGAWKSGSITGARVRGGISVDIKWSRGKLQSYSISVDRNAQSREVAVQYLNNTLVKFITRGGMTVGH
jgi:alpha-L-fucosidase 2